MERDGLIEVVVGVELKWKVGEGQRRIDAHNHSKLSLFNYNPTLSFFFGCQTLLQLLYVRLYLLIKILSPNLMCELHFIICIMKVVN